MRFALAKRRLALLMLHPRTMFFVRRVVRVAMAIYPLYLPPSIRTFKLFVYLNGVTGLWCLSSAWERAGTVWAWVNIASAVLNFLVMRRSWRLFHRYKAEFDAELAEFVRSEVAPELLQRLETMMQGLKGAIPLARLANTRVNRDAEEET
jgi:hypothetical protein